MSAAEGVTGALRDAGELLVIRGRIFPFFDYDILHRLTWHRSARRNLALDPVEHLRWQDHLIAAHLRTVQKA